MVDVKISALGAITTVAGEDLVAIIDDPSGTPVSKKATIDQIKTYVGGITASSTDTFTNKTFDADGTGNSITNIENADIKASAGIVVTKLAPGTANYIVKTNSGGTALEHGLIANANIDASAGIAYSKLTLTGAVTDGDLAGSISLAKLATDPLARANHTGTQAQSTITNLVTDLSAKAPLASPTFTGTVSIPTLNMTGRLSYNKGADVASPAGGILTLGTDGNIFDITGTNTINEITPTNWQSGSIIILQFDGILQLTHNSGGTNDILLGDGNNFTTSAGDSIMLWYNGTDWIEVARSSGVGGGGGGATATHAYTNQSSTSYRGTGSAGTGIDVATTVATEASGAGEREIYIRKIDTNNEGVFTVIHKNGSAVEVQIA